MYSIHNICLHIYLHTYIYIHINLILCRASALPIALARYSLRHGDECPYGQFSIYHVCFCGLDPGNLKLETVRTNKQHICF